MPVNIDDVFRQPKPPKVPKPKKPKIVTKLMLAKKAAIEKKKAKVLARDKENEVARQAARMGVEKVAVEVFGEGGLTPARQRALSEVLVGPDGGQIGITNANQLRYLVKKARERFLELANSYMDEHISSIQGARLKGEFDTAARHAEWALDRLGDGVERVTDVPVAPQRGFGQGGVAPVMVGVNIGGSNQK